MAQPARKKMQKMTTSQRSTQGSLKETSKENAASKLAVMIEEHMSNIGLSEQEKDVRVSKFTKRVDVAIENHAKS
jgi:hypothetical protein